MPWDAIASALAAQCSLRDVEAALGTRAAEVIPELNRLTTLAVELPRWQTLMLARHATREHSDPGDYLFRHLLDLAACESEFLSSEIPGFLEGGAVAGGGSG